MTLQENVFSRFPIHAGAIFGIVPLPLHLFMPSEPSYQLAALSLVLIAGIYVGFAFRDGRSSVLWIELSGAALFLGAAWLGLIGFPQAIILALFLHGAWDLLHISMIKTQIPNWYAGFCIVTDWLMAAGLWIIWTFVH